MALSTNSDEKKVTGKVIRPFFYQGKPLKKGKKQEFPLQFAREMEAANKLEIVLDQVAVSADKDAVDLTK